MKCNAQNSEAGNALWFILLAVALLAALTAAISRSSDTAEQSGDIERYRIQASDLLRHSASVKQAVNNISMRGFSENEVSFENSFVSGAIYTNANCTEGGCLVYSNEGGGVNYKTPPSAVVNSGSNGEDRYREWEFVATNDVTGVGTTAPDLIMYVGYLQRNLCRQINNLLDIPEVSGDVPADNNGFDHTAFQGAIASTATENIDNMTGEEAGCFNDTSVSGRDYTFYQVLRKR